MNNRTRKHLGNQSDAKKLSSLRNLHQDQDCVILACGPSIVKYSKEIKSIKDKIIIAVKQSYNIAPYANYHLLNFINYQKYTYGQPRPIILELFKKGYPKGNSDIMFPFVFSRSLAETHKFGKYLMNKTFYTPLGPRNYV